MRSYRILRRTSLLLVLSFVLHVGVALGLWWITPDEPIVIGERESYVDLLESPELRRRPKQIKKQDFFVKDTEVPDELLTDEKKETDLSSAEERNVIEERIARRSGPTVNRGGNAESSTSAGTSRPRANTSRKKLEINPGRSLRQMAEEEASNVAGDIEVGRSLEKKQRASEGRPLDFSKFGSVEKGLSTFGGGVEHDVRFGDFTALNTERHLYYTFFSRIEDGIRNRWVNYVKAVTYGIENGTERIDGYKKQWTTTVEILLDDKGTFQKAILHESSGSRGLDSAGVQAFRDAIQFPNPPPEMVKDDGKIHLLFVFNVHYIPQVARFGDAPPIDESEN